MRKAGQVMHLEISVIQACPNHLDGWKDRCTEIEDQAVITAVLRVLLDPTI
jgi:hypothetical protein